MQNSNRIPVADYSSVGPLGFVANDVPTDSSFSTDRPSVSTSALSRGSSLGLTATALRVTSPSRSTPEIASILRTLAGLGSLASRVDLPSVAEEGEGQASSTGQSGSTLNGHGHVRAISQIPQATSHKVSMTRTRLFLRGHLARLLKRASLMSLPLITMRHWRKFTPFLGDLLPQADQLKAAHRFDLCLSQY